MFKTVLVPVSFRDRSGAHECVAVVGDSGAYLTTDTTSNPDSDALALTEHLVSTAIERNVVTRSDVPRQIFEPALVGFDAPSGTLVYTTALPAPLAESQHDVLTGTDLSWRVLIDSGGRRPSSTAEIKERVGVEALVLNYWRQAFEETDAALDFLPHYFSLWSLRRLYDALWGFDQDPSGFKRWAILGEEAAFAELLVEHASAEAENDQYFDTLGRLTSSSSTFAKVSTATLAGASVVGLGAAAFVPAAVAAATAGVKRAKHRPGPKPVWLEKTDAWSPGPTCLSSVYAPRPAWTHWKLT